MSYTKVVVIGTSLGGVEALTHVLGALPKEYRPPIIVVQHLSPQSGDFWIKYIGDRCSLTIKEAEEKELICPNMIYVAPANYHLLVEEDRTFSLGAGEKVNFSRPSIDVLFETAADAFGEHLVGVVLTGASVDGTNGLLKIKKCGGTTVVQDPETAEAKLMPTSAIKACVVDCVGSLDTISEFLNRFQK